MVYHLLGFGTTKLVALGWWGFVSFGWELIFDMGRNQKRRDSSFCMYLITGKWTLCDLWHFVGRQQRYGQFLPDNGARLNHGRGQVLTDFGAADCSAFCSAFVQRTFGEAGDSTGWLLDPKSPLCLDEPRGFGGNGRQWTKCSARENWLRVGKTQFQDHPWKTFTNHWNPLQCSFQ